MLGVLLISVGLNVVHRRNFAEYVGRRAVLARRLVTSIHINLAGALSCLICGALETHLLTY